MTDTCNTILRDYASAYGPSLGLVLICVPIAVSIWLSWRRRRPVDIQVSDPVDAPREAPAPSRGPLTAQEIAEHVAQARARSMRRVNEEKKA